MNIIDSLRLEIIEKLPTFYSARKIYKRKLAVLMREYGYDEEIIENMSDDFCLGFQTAKEIILKIMDEERKKNN